MHKLLRNTVHTTLHWWKKSIFCATQHWNHSVTQTLNITFFTASDVTLVAIHVMWWHTICAHTQKFYMNQYNDHCSFNGRPHHLSYKQVSNTQKRSSFDHNFLCVHNFSLPGKITSIILTFSAPFSSLHLSLSHIIHPHFFLILFVCHTVFLSHVFTPLLSKHCHVTYKIIQDFPHDPCPLWAQQLHVLPQIIKEMWQYVHLLSNVSLRLSDQKCQLSDTEYMSCKSAKP